MCAETRESLRRTVSHLMLVQTLCVLLHTFHPCSFGIMMFEVFTRQSAYARMLYGQIYHQVRSACTDSRLRDDVLKQYFAKVVGKKSKAIIAVCRIPLPFGGDRLHVCRHATSGYGAVRVCISCTVRVCNNCMHAALLQDTSDAKVTEFVPK